MIKKRVSFSLIHVAGLFFLAFIVSTLGYVSMAAAASKTDTSGKRLITIHDRGVERGFLSNKATLREVFNDESISVDPHDVIEPGLDTKLESESYQVNVYRARPVTVIDGNNRISVMSAHQTAKQIASDAEITLQNEDTTKLVMPKDLLTDGMSVQLEITRAILIHLVLYGKDEKVYTQAKTVDELLKEKKITLGADDTLSVAGSTFITKDLKIELWRNGKQTVTNDEVIESPIEIIKDANKKVGTEEVKEQGVAGKKSVTYEIEMKNGQELSRKEIQSVVITEATKTVKIVGTKPDRMPYTGGGSKTDWLSASNIPSEHWGYADFMVGRESGWNPNATNRSSGACGLAQALPCSKVPGDPYNPVNSLNWMNGYVNGRYGGWEGAYSFWQRNHWY